MVVSLADDGRRVDLLAPAWNVRSKVHEYGGGAWTPAGESGLVFANWADQRLYLVSSPGEDPQPLTPEPVEPQGDRSRTSCSPREGTRSSACASTSRRTAGM